MNRFDPIVIHYVYDMQRAITFYCTVFDVQTSFESPGWSTVDFESFQLALHILAPSNDDEGPIPHAGLNLLVNNIENTQLIIEQQGGQLIELREPTSFVRQRVATFQDSEGNGFELRQNP